jgi:hypothetical protein
MSSILLEEENIVSFAATDRVLVMNGEPLAPLSTSTSVLMMFL